MTKYRVVTTIKNGDIVYQVEDNSLFGLWTNYKDWMYYANLKDAIDVVDVLVLRQETKQNFKSKVVYGPLP